MLSMTLQESLSAVWRRSQPLYAITILGVGVCVVCLHSFHDTHKSMAETEDSHLNYLLAIVVVEHLTCF